MGKVKQHHNKQNQKVSLVTADDRRKLNPRKNPYWIVVDTGVALGLWVGVSGQTWVARRQSPYKECTIGVPEGQAPQEGRPVLTYGQAVDAALQWARLVEPAPEVLEPVVEAFSIASIVSFTPPTPGTLLLEIAAEGGRHVPGLGRVPADPLVWDALEEHLYVMEMRQLTGIGNSRSLIRNLQREVGMIPLRLLTSQMLTDWMGWIVSTSPRRRSKKNGDPNDVQGWDPMDPDSKRKRQATANRKFATLRAALHRANKNKWPHAGLAWMDVEKFPYTHSSRKEVLSAQEQADFLNNCSPELRPLGYAALLTGCRYGPMRRWKVKNFKPLERLMVIGFDKAHQCDRVAPLTDEAIVVFECITVGRDPEEFMFLKADGEPWGKGHQGRPMKEATQVLNQKISFYSLRHTCITTWLEYGIPKSIVAKAVNTSEMMIDAHYEHIEMGKSAESISAKVPTIGKWGQKGDDILAKYAKMRGERMYVEKPLTFTLESLHPSAYVGKADGGRYEAAPKKPRPSAEELAALVKEQPLSCIADTYGVSQPTVKKWCKQAGLEVPGRGYWQKRRAEERQAIRRAEGGLFSGGQMPTREELEPLIKAFPATEVAKRYGVRGPTVLKWASKLGIRCPGPGHWAKVDGKRQRKERQARRQAWKEQESQPCSGFDSGNGR